MVHAANAALAILILSIATIHFLMPFVRKYLWWGIGLRKNSDTVRAGRHRRQSAN